MDLENALAALTPKQRRAALLYAQGYTQAEIGEMMEVTQQAVCRLLENLFLKMNMLYFA
jgi:RNA polymerase sigma factor (sigma-70 family)